jgi:hypothetical protein
MADGNWPVRRLPSLDSEIVPTGLTVKLEEYWRSVLNGRTMPARSDIDPAGMRRLLPHVFLIDVVDRPPRFRWRLVGTRIGDMEHAEYTGKWLEETLRHPQDPFLYFCRMSVNERRPACHAALRSDPDGGSRPLIRTLLPLSEDGQAVTMLLGGIDYAPGEILPLQRGAA